MPASSAASGIVSRAPHFTLNMTIACLAIAVIGFAPTYWRGLTTGTFRGGALVHLHALVFYGWMVLLVVQAALIAHGRVLQHRTFGLCGIALATALVISGVAVSIAAGVKAEANGFAREARAFVIVSWSSMAVFAWLFTCAIANAREPDRHSRYMLAATISMLGAPIARWFLVLFAPETLAGGGVAAPPPVIVSVPPAMVGYLLFGIMLWHERRTHGAFHTVTVTAAVATTAVSILIVPVSATPFWQAFAGAVFALAK